MKTNKILLTLMLGVFLISFASAQIQSLGTFKLGDDINLIQTCDNCTFNNITSVLYPNSTQTIGEFSMTKTGTIYNFTLSSARITEVGIYIVNGFGDLNGIDTVWNYNFEVTPSGVIQESILNNSVLLILVFLSLIFLVIGAYYKIASFGFIGSILLILSGVYTMIYGFNNYTDLYTRGAAVSLIGLGIIIMFVSAYEWLPWGEGGGE